MELPKNITQVGEPDRYCKVYVEDYVISHIKQMNRQAQNKEMTVALYGTVKEEEGVTYLFCYGAARLHTLLREVRHLSQAQTQEVEKNRKQYFPEYEFLGYRLLNGEMLEGFQVCEKWICRYVQGFACFYEKNDAMLSYMLNSRKEEAEPESVDLEKYEKVKKRQEERKKEAERTLREQKQEREQRKLREMTAAAAMGRGRMRTAAAAGFLTVCVLGIAGVYYLGDREDIQTAADKLITSWSEQKQPAGEEQEREVASETVVSEVLVAEDKLTEVLQQENAASYSTEPGDDSTDTLSASEQPNDQPEATPSEATQPEKIQPEVAQPESVQPETQITQQTSGTQDADSKEVSSDNSQTIPATYTIRRGDTLTEISVQIYGTDRRVQDICELNGIDDPDDIRFGQKLLLP